MAHQVKDLALSLLWLWLHGYSWGADLIPGLQQVQPKKKKVK